MLEPLEKVKFGGNEVESLMVKTRKLSDIQQEFAFTEFNLYQRNQRTSIFRNLDTSSHFALFERWRYRSC